MKIMQISDDVTLSYPMGDVMKRAYEAAQEMGALIRSIYPDPRDQRFAFLCQGTSGSIMSALLATQLLDYELRLVIVRKPGEKSHSGTAFPYIHEDELVVIADDFVSSGDTIRRIYRDFHNHTGREEVDIVAVTGYCEKSQNFDAFRPNYLICSELRE